MAQSQYLNLDPNEVTIVTAAAQIYSAYIAAGRVVEGSESGWMARAVDEAVALAMLADSRVLAKGEMT